MGGFQDFKLFLIETFGLAKDALHIYVGLIVFFGAALLFRLSLRDIRLVLAVLLAAVAGELWDIYDTEMIGGTQIYEGNWHDIWNTMFWPVMIMLLARYTPIMRR